MKLKGHDLLYLIADSAQTKRPIGETIEEAFRSGIRLVQLREKHLPDEDYLALARDVRSITTSYGARLLINSRLHIALDVGADGVHLPRDASIAGARRALGPEPLIGFSAHSEEELRRAGEEGADFVTLSPLFPTPSKIGYTAILGLERFAALVQTTSLPVFALGGVRIENVSDCLKAGAYGIAVMGAIMGATNIADQVRAYLHALRLFTPL